MISMKTNRFDFINTFSDEFSKMDVFCQCDYMLFLLLIYKYANEYENGSHMNYIEIADNSNTFSTRRINGFIKNIEINNQLSNISLEIIDEEYNVNRIEVKSIRENVIFVGPNKFYIDSKETRGKFNIWFKHSNIDV